MANTNNPIQPKLADESGEQRKISIQVDHEITNPMLRDHKKARLGWLFQSKEARREKEARMSLGQRIISSQQRETTIGVLSVFAAIVLVAVASTAIIVTRDSSVKDDGAGGHMLVDKSTGEVVQTAEATGHWSLSTLAERGEPELYESMKSLTISVGELLGDRLTSPQTTRTVAIASSLWVNKTRMVIAGQDGTLVLTGGGETIVMEPRTASIYFDADSGNGMLSSSNAAAVSNEATLVGEATTKCQEARCPLSRCSAEATSEGVRQVKCNGQAVWNWPTGVAIGAEGRGSAGENEGKATSSTSAGENGRRLFYSLSTQKVILNAYVNARRPYSWRNCRRGGRGC
jgi:hypothetical protein